MGTPRVALVSLGCARNEVDSEELAGRLAADGFHVVDSPHRADAVLVNTCGFIDAAKAESVDTVLSLREAPKGGQPAVVAVGCMAERYGEQLAEALPEADAVLGFDHYPHIAERLRVILAGGHVRSHTPRDRRSLLPLAPAARQGTSLPVPGHGASPPTMPIGGRTEPVGPAWVRRRIGGGPVAALKIASGCDRRCSFCAIPSFRGAFVSRPADEVVAEAHWLAGHDARELVLVSENSTSYGKDLGDPDALASLVTALGMVPGIERIRVSYLQPAELRPGLVRALVEAPRVANYFDLSFQHASAPLLRRMRRFGGSGPFLDLLAQIRALSPAAGIRSNVIVGFPGETEADVDELLSFLAAAQLDAVGVFGYSDEEGTEAAGLGDKVDEAEVRARVDAVSSMADEVMAQRAQQRIGDRLDVLVETMVGLVADGRAEHQGPEDGSTRVRLAPDPPTQVGPGSLVRARVVASDGVDLQAVEVSGVEP